MSKRFLYNFLRLLALAVPLTGCYSSAQSLLASAQPAPTRVVTESKQLSGAKDPADKATLKLPLADPRIEVRKAERKLLLFSKGRLVRACHVGLGHSPVGDKERDRDRRTPEGDFYVFTKNAKSAFYLSLVVSYPNLAHAKR